MKKLKMHYVWMFFIMIVGSFLYGCGGGGDSGNATGLALSNPAAAYCSDLGYTYNSTSDRCVFNDRSYCDAWAFYRGTCGQSKTYCEQNGGLIKSITETVGTATYQYAVCQFNDGTECNEQDYADGKCTPGKCDTWRMSQGGCVK